MGDLDDNSTANSTVEDFRRQIRQRGQTDPAKVRDAIAAEMRREFGGDPGTVALQAIMFEATKI